MKNIILISLLLNGYWAMAQNIEKQVIGSTGSTSITSSLIITSTIGEAQVQTQSNASIILSAGYQHANNNATSNPKLEVNNGLTLYPNPTRGISKIEMTTQMNANITIKIYSSLGIQVNTSILQLAVGSTSSTQIDLTHQAKGVYYVSVLDEQNHEIQTFKLLKL